MSLQPHNVLDFIQSGKVFSVRPKPYLEDKQYLDVMSSWYSGIRQLLPAIECFDITIDLGKFRRQDWDHVSHTAQLLIECDAYRLPYPAVWLSYPEISYLLTEEYDDKGDFFVRSQAFLRTSSREDGQSMAVGGMTVRHYPSRDLAARRDSERHPASHDPLGDDDSNIGIHAQVEIPYGAPMTDEEAQNIERISTVQVTAFLVMINTKGVPRERIEPPVKLNRSRARKKKSPILSLTRIALPKGMLARREKTEGATRASPRLHWRKGYVSSRWRETGQWIEPCIVGLPETGMVGRKTYRIATQVPTEYREELMPTRPAEAKLNFAPEEVMSVSSLDSNRANSLADQETTDV